MNAIKQLHRFDHYGHHNAPESKAHVFNSHPIYCYLQSISDVALALGIMIIICASSLFTLYTALGAI